MLINTWIFWVNKISFWSICENYKLDEKYLQMAKYAWYACFLMKNYLWWDTKIGNTLKIHWRKYTEQYQSPCKSNITWFKLFKLIWIIKPCFYLKIDCWVIKNILWIDGNINLHTKTCSPLVVLSLSLMPAEALVKVNYGNNMQNEVSQGRF